MTHPLRSTGITPLQHYKETDSPPQLDSDDAAMTYERFIRCGSAKPVANYYEAVRPSPAHQYFRSKGLPSSLVQLRTAVWTGVTRDTMP
jgi:hypothetical protein